MFVMTFICRFKAYCSMLELVLTCWTHRVPLLFWL